MAAYTTGRAQYLIGVYGDGPHVEAVKAYREMTGCGLSQALDDLCGARPPIPFETLLAGAERTRAESLAAQSKQRTLADEHARYKVALELIAREAVDLIDRQFFNASVVARRVLAGWPVDLADVPQYDHGHYVVVSELPPQRQGQFRAWLAERARPHINGVALECAYAHDFEVWVESLMAAGNAG